MFQMRYEVRSKIVGAILARAAPQRMSSRAGGPIKNKRKRFQIRRRAVAIIMEASNIDANYRRLALKMKFILMFLIAGPFPSFKSRKIETQNHKDANSASRVPRRAYPKAA